MIGPQELRALTMGRWIVPVMALLAEEKGARFARMLNGLGIPRDSLARTLEQLAANGWAMRNPGHGHPLRPEYVLTAAGEEIGTACVRMMAVRQRLGLAPDALPRWSLPILGRLDDDWTRFTDLRVGLTPITPRALSLNLQHMIGGGVIARRIDRGFPPASLYGLAGPGRELVRSINAA